MIIFPAIDIKDQNCVRLYKGDFNKKKIYNKSPLDQAKKFEKLGFKYLHIVDLDRALNLKKTNLELIKSIIENTKLKIQLGGGMRTLDDMEEVLNIGVTNVIIGTLAVKNHDLLLEACEKFPYQISVALDARDGFLALKGWTDQTRIKALDFFDKIKNLKLKSIIYTDIEKDGTKSDINFFETFILSKESKIPVIASGGVASIEQIITLKKYNFYGVIIGTAIYDGDIDLQKLLKL